MTDEDKKYGLRKGARFSEAEVAFLALTCKQFNMTESDVIRCGPPAIHFVHTLLSRLDEIHALCVDFVSTMPRRDISRKTLSDVRPSIGDPCRTNVGQTVERRAS